jgi:hypothetical protein
MDGNCLFNSMALQLEFKQDNIAATVRHDLVKFIEQNEEIVSAVMNPEQKQIYITNMRRSGVHGDGIILFAAVAYNGYPIVVISPETNAVQNIDSDATTGKKPLHIGLYKEHYVSICLTDHDANSTETTQCALATTSTDMPTSVLEHVEQLEDLETKNTQHNSIESVVHQYDVGCFVDCATTIDDFTKCQLLENPWTPDRTYDLPFSLHQKKTHVEKRYVGHSHLELYHWLVYSHAKKGLFCKYCPFFVPGHLGGMNKATPLRTLVTKPLTSFAKLLGKDGDLEVQSRNKYHLEAVENGKSFLKSYHNPSQTVVNQVSHQRLKQITENRERLRPIVESIIFLAKQNIPLRGHRDDGSIIDETSSVASPVINEGNFRELLRFRIQSGDAVLKKHLKTASATATYVSKTVQNEIIDCCGLKVRAAILGCVHESQYYSIMFDETTDTSHTSQMSLSLRYVHKGILREDFIQFLDVHQQHQALSENSSELSKHSQRAAEQNV